LLTLAPLRSLKYTHSWLTTSGSDSYSTWLVHLYSPRALRADSPKTPLATSFYFRVTYHVIITQASQWSAGGRPAENGLLPSRNRYWRHLRMRRHEGNSSTGLLRHPAGVPRHRCCAMPWANPSHYVFLTKNIRIVIIAFILSVLQCMLWEWRKAEVRNLLIYFLSFLW
jgi:hypothetical protein